MPRSSAKILKSTFCLLFTGTLVAGQAWGSVGFGSRKSAPTSNETTSVVPSGVSGLPASSASTSPIVSASPSSLSVAISPPSPSNNTSLPSPGDNAEWMRVPFDQAENELFALFQRDLPKIEELSKELAVYEARTSGKLPQDYRRNLRSKFERVLLTSKTLSIKQCGACEEARVYRDDGGNLKYESYSSDRSRPAKVAAEIGVAQLLYTEMSYTPEDLQLRVRLVDAPSGRVLWTREYSTADVVKTREALRDADAGNISHGDALGSVLIGEVAFTAVLSPGVGMLPTIDNGAGTSLATYPSVDLFLGEKFDRGRKVFGFLIGGVFNMGATSGGSGTSSGGPGGTPLPWAMRIAPRFRYVFNPYNTTSVRWSVAGELGGLISTGLTTGYIGIGPEIAMIKRFSVSLTPIYILPSNVSKGDVFKQGDSGTFSSDSSGSAGKFGGPGILMKASINW